MYDTLCKEIIWSNLDRRICISLPERTGILLKDKPNEHIHFALNINHSYKKQFSVLKKYLHMCHSDEIYHVTLYTGKFHFLA